MQQSPKRKTTVGFHSSSSRKCSVRSKETPYLARPTLKSGRSIGVRISLVTITKQLVIGLIFFPVACFAVTTIPFSLSSGLSAESSGVNRTLDPADKPRDVGIKSVPEHLRFVNYSLPSQDSKTERPNFSSSNHESNPQAQAYLRKFLTYEFWLQHLPEQPQPGFIEFIEPISPLTQQLREKWLILLAKKNDWITFKQHYRASKRPSLQCYAQMAEYKLHTSQAAVNEALNLWLSPNTLLSSACQNLFTLLQNEHAFHKQQIDQKIAWSLEHDRYVEAYEILLKQGTHTQEVQRLALIRHNPRNILGVQPGPLAGSLYLYGLKLMVIRDTHAAIGLWCKPLTNKILSHSQHQQFLAHLALYKAMRNEADAAYWLAKVQPVYRSPILRDWEIRYALMQKNWQQILDMTKNDSLKSAEPFQIYWRARALDKLGQSVKAKTLYQTLATKRHYYGFLSSIALNLPLQFESEPARHASSILTVYQPILDRIAESYHNRQTYLAAHMLNEFSMELSKTEKSALVYWVATQLHWLSKAIYLSSTDEALKNHLLIRFPIAYCDSIQKLAAQYNISAALIYATIRQESSFSEDIQSVAGAYGLMQILPTTAKTIAKQAKIPYSDAQALFNPQENLHIGVAYLNTLYHQFGGHPVLVMAAYNAGPKQVRHWVTRHHPQEIDLWIESLPWQETRNYLKNVMSFYAVYQYRLHQNPNLSPFLTMF